MRLLLWPRSVALAVGLAGVFWFGWGLNNFSPLKSESRLGVETIHVPGSVSTQVKTVKRVVRGRVIRREHKVYVWVPVVIVRTDHHVIRVPAHKLPLRSASATVANPLVTVSVAVPTTVYLPSPPVTVTTTVTDLATTTITVSVPIVDVGSG